MWSLKTKKKNKQTKKKKKKKKKKHRHKNHNKNEQTNKQKWPENAIKKNLHYAYPFLPIKITLKMNSIALRVF